MKAIYHINQDFFKKWNSKMAYILGFTYADGCVHKRTLSWELSNKFSSDKILLENFNKIMESNYPIKDRPKSFRLRVSNPEILRDINNLGVMQNKSKIILFPDLPKEMVPHFIRGVLDADGWICAVVKHGVSKEISVGFSSGSLKFMEGLVEVIKSNVQITNFNLRRRIKITKRGIFSNCYQLDFYSQNALNLIDFLYGSLKSDDLYLSRKYDKHTIAKKYFEETSKIKKHGRKWLNLEENNNSEMNKLLNEMLSQKNMIPREIAVQLGISLSTLYRWLDKSKTRIMVKRGSAEWVKRVVDSRRLKNGI